MHKCNSKQAELVVVVYFVTTLKQIETMNLGDSKGLGEYMGRVRGRKGKLETRKLYSNIKTT